MKQFIKLEDREARAKICKTYGVTTQALCFALNFKRNSKTATAMRKMALENGGTLYVESKNNKTL